MTNIFMILFMVSSFDRGRFGIQFDLHGQEQCEEMCFSCVARGNEPEDCASRFMFRFCCRQNGGRVSGCGCREGL